MVVLLVGAVWAVLAGAGGEEATERSDDVAEGAPGPEETTLRFVEADTCQAVVDLMTRDYRTFESSDYADSCREEERTDSELVTSTVLSHDLDTASVAVTVRVDDSPNDQSFVVHLAAVDGGWKVDGIGRSPTGDTSRLDDLATVPGPDDIGDLPPGVLPGADPDAEGKSPTAVVTDWLSSLDAGACERAIEQWSDEGIDHDRDDLVDSCNRRGGLEVSYEAVTLLGVATQVATPAPDLEPGTAIVAAEVGFDGETPERVVYRVVLEDGLWRMH